MSNTCDNKTCISPLTLAALLTAARLFSLSLYMPRAGENAAMTAVCAAALCLLKLPVMLLAARLGCRLRESRLFALVLLLGSCGMIFLAAGSFSEMTAEAYPERCTRLTTVAVLLFICAYVASMGVAGTARTASLTLFGFAAVCLPVLSGMRGSMLTDRLDLFSPEPLTEAARTSAGLLRLFCEPFIMAGLGSKAGRPERSVRPYLITDALVSGVFFLMCGTVMGRFFGHSGYALFTLSGNTHGTIIDRANGVFTFFSSAFAILTVSALMIAVMKCTATLRQSSTNLRTDIETPPP